METADSLKEKLQCNTDDQLGSLFHVTGKAVSVWRKNGLPDKIQERAQEMLSSGSRNAAMQINGDNHKIDIHHTEQRGRYSPATEMILDIIKEWDEKRRRKVAVKAEEMNVE